MAKKIMSVANQGPSSGQCFEIGVDTGGTFTDLVCLGDKGFSYLAKVPSTPDDPSRAVLQSIDLLISQCGMTPDQIVRFVHGTTIATNAIIERKGAKLGLLTTRGFKDILEIGRQMRSGLYDVILRPETPVFLAPGRFRKEVTERIGPDGEIVVPLDEDSVRASVGKLLKLGVDAIAVSYLFSFRHPGHETRTREIIREMAPQLPVSISSEVDPAAREYERTVATAFDAYLKPVVDGYLQNLEIGLRQKGISARLQVMQSRGGIASVQSARKRPITLTRSGPASGIAGGRISARLSDISDVITVDIGGTSCDIALIADGKAITCSEGQVDGYPVRVSMVDVNAIGSGGGSIAWIDEAGGLRVGPRSAGSMPGPACYDRGGQEATVTDASIVLGYLNPDYFAGGSFKLNPALSHQAIEEKIAQPLAMSVEEAALGVHRVLNAQMAEGIRFVSIKQGFDVRDFALVSMGGAGGLHAAALAEELGIDQVLVPRHPGVLSAEGLLGAVVEQELSTPMLVPLDSLDTNELRSAFRELDAKCLVLAQAEGLDGDETHVFCFADLCYQGQSFHLEVPVDRKNPDMVARLRKDFYCAHDRVFGQSTDGLIKVVNLRIVRRSPSVNRLPTSSPPAGSVAEISSRRRVLLPGAGSVYASIFQRDALPEGYETRGPAIIEQRDTTVILPPGWRLTVPQGGNLLLDRSVEI